MRIGIIGSGNIGGTLGKHWARLGHLIMFSSRHPEQLRELAAQAGPNAQVGTVEQAADFGEVVLIAIPFGQYHTLPADRLVGKIVIDATNYYPQRDGAIDMRGLASSELIAQHLPGAYLVKAFNTINFRSLESEGRDDPDRRLAVFVAGDDPDAKMVVGGLIDEIGFAPLDTGSLHDSTRQEPGSPIYNQPITAAEARQLLQTF